MRHAALWIASVIASVGTGAAQAQHAEVAPVVFDTQVRIDVGRDGKVVGATPDRQFPDVIDAAVRSHVLAWTFEPPGQPGAAVEGTTYARLRGCAASTPSGLNVAFEPARTGPGHGTRGIPGVHQLTIPFSLFQLGAFDIEAVYQVNTDGSVAVESVTSRARRTRDMRAFEREIHTWLSSRRMLPEMIDGRPVATRMSLPISYEFSRVERSAAPDPGSLAAAQPSCQAAMAGLDEARQAVALDSVFKRKPSG